MQKLETNIRLANFVSGCSEVTAHRLTISLVPDGEPWYIPGMSDERRPLWPWNAALLIGLPVLYVALFGPACWLADNGTFSMRATSIAYRPLLISVPRFPIPIRKLLRSYAEWYARPTVPSWVSDGTDVIYCEAGVIERLLLDSK